MIEPPPDVDPKPRYAAPLHERPAEGDDTWQPIGYHGVIGDMHTACLVGQNGSVDWYPYPHFDDAPVFAALLDSEQGGRFSITPQGGRPSRQLYLPDTNVLLTRLLGEDGMLEITDLMPVKPGHVEDDEAHWHGLVRRVRAVRGDVRTRLTCTPTFGYASRAPKVQLYEGGARFEGPDQRLYLTSPVDLEPVSGGPGEAGVEAAFTVSPGEPSWFVMADPAEGVPMGAAPSSPASMNGLLEDTMLYWRSWADQCTYTGRWQERVLRSALTLKLLTFAPTGAIVAAPTTSLPESIGGARNWDYRFTWLRDAAFTLRALFRLGFVEEGDAFLGWLVDRIQEATEEEPIQVLYGIDGRTDLTEETLDHLSGYMGSKPVRVGNAAFDQRQLDIFGEVLETISDYAEHVSDLGETWEGVIRMLDWLVEHWREPDEGIWEVRGPRRHFVYSKVMCWVAFDRAIRIAEAHDLPGDVETWREEREAVREQVLERGVDPEDGRFVQAYGSDRVDASNLLIPLFGFVSPDDPRAEATVEATLEELTTDGLVHRYRAERVDDGLEDREGTFSLCSFWLVDNLVLQGELDRAWLEFEKLLTHGNHLDLYAEQLGFQGESLGNFPQAFTHIGLIHSALLLDKALTARRMTQQPEER